MTAPMIKLTDNQGRIKRVATKYDGHNRKPRNGKREMGQRASRRKMRARLRGTVR